MIFFDQFSVSKKFGKCLTEFIIPTALLKKFIIIIIIIIIMSLFLGDYILSTN